jgi:uncharacterized protein (TIGR02246 family)
VLGAAVCGALVLSACTPAAPPPPAVNAPDDIAAIGALRSSFAAAWNAGDLAALEALRTQDAVSMPNHQPTSSGLAAIKAAETDFFAQASPKMELMSDETRTVGTWGFDRGRYKMTMTPKAGGDAMVDEGRYIVILEKGSDGRWRVARDIDNSTMPMPPPPPPMKGK